MESFSPTMKNKEASTVTMLHLEFPLPDGSAVVHKDTLIVDLGNGVTLKSSIPTWVKSVYKATLRLEMEIEGSPDAKTQRSSIKSVHEAPLDGGQ